MTKLVKFRAFRLDWKSDGDYSHHYEFRKDIPAMGSRAYFGTEKAARAAAHDVVLVVAERCAAAVKEWTAKQHPPAPQSRPEYAEREWKNTASVTGRHVFILQQRWAGVDAEWNLDISDIHREPNPILTARFRCQYRYSYREAQSKSVVHPDGRIETTYSLAPPGEWSKWGNETRGYYAAQIPDTLRIEVQPVEVSIAGALRKVRR